ncbi:MAG: aminotransferase class III-fold pyridoxal phosphate-dependent enzyme [Spirochaetales bacterium]|nr:aminotransferase class III-fold pyridoxal phosphate-dependent enzyme [Spirochaetales bacterium]
MRYVYNSSGHELKIPDIVKSKGIYITDSSGKKYMDLESGVWCLSLGHRNERINRTILKQISILTQAGFCYSCKIVDQAAHTVLSTLKMEDGKAVFLCSGSEGIEYTRQVAKHLTGKTLSMTLHDSYLGAYSSVSKRDKDWFCLDWTDCADCERKESCDENCPLLKQIPEDISDFIFEPGSSSGLVRFPPKPLIQKIVKIIRNNGGKIIVNEVTTGIGRTGKWYGFMHFDISPDMVALGKGIGNGYPVSAACMSKEIILQLEQRPFKYTQSHQNDPLGASVAREVIQTIIDEGLIEKANRMGRDFLPLLNSLVDGKKITKVRGRGLMFAIDFKDSKFSEEVYIKLLSEGYITGNRGTSLRIDPPLIITELDFEKFVDKLKEII